MDYRFLWLERTREMMAQTATIKENKLSQVTFICITSLSERSREGPSAVVVAPGYWVPLTS